MRAWLASFVVDKSPLLSTTTQNPYRVVNSFLRRSFSSRARFTKPTILFQDNHLVAVNKPPRWLSVPNPPGVRSRKSQCLLNYLKTVKRVGGGSDRAFLLPLHRLDQPCSGLLLFGKTSKAASRIQPQWKFVEKTYLAVVPTECLDNLRRNSSRTVAHDGVDENGSSDWLELRGIIRGKRPPNRKSKKLDESSSSRDDFRGGWSVVMEPCKNHDSKRNDNNRTCRFKWRLLSHAARSSSLLEIQTNQGARHMIRALLSSHDCPVIGDTRYGTSRALKDRSIALHARQISLPEEHIKLNLSQRTFSAPIPERWKQHFGLQESDVTSWEQKRHD